MTAFTFRAPRPLGLRVWHWLNSAAIFGLLGTVYLRDYLLNVRESKTQILNTVSSLGGSVSPEQATAVARLYRDHLWNWHVNLGLALTALLVMRAVVEFSVPEGTALCAKIKNALGSVKTDEAAKSFAAVKIGHALFYGLLAVIVVTGLLMAYDDALHIPESVHRIIHPIHEYSMYLVIAFIGAHLFGVVRAEKTTDPGLVSDMINGG